jgi:hypothetical protein
MEFWFDLNTMSGRMGISVVYAVSAMIAMEGREYLESFGGNRQLPMYHSLDVIGSALWLDMDRN